MCLFWGEKYRPVGHLLTHRFPRAQGKLARVQVWLKTSSAWPTTTSSMVLKYKVMVRKGSKRYIGTGCPFSTFFAPFKSFLCRLDQTKSVQSTPTPQQTFWPRFETLAMQIGLKKTEIIFFGSGVGCRVSIFHLFRSPKLISVPIGPNQECTKATHATTNVLAQVWNPGNANRT